MAYTTTSRASTLAPPRGYASRIWSPGLHEAVGCFIGLVGVLGMDFYRHAWQYYFDGFDLCNPCNGFCYTFVVLITNKVYVHRSM
jgi:hypothetical protein